MKFRKKPVVIEAIQYKGDSDSAREIFNWANSGRDSASNCIVLPYETVIASSPPIRINTPEGTMYAFKGSWIIKGVNGEFYPCKPDIFEKTYEKVEESKDEQPNL